MKIKNDKLKGLENYQSRMRLWKDELLLSKSQHEVLIKSNSEQIKLMQREQVIHEKQIDLTNEELLYADKELIRNSEEMKRISQ